MKKYLKIKDKLVEVEMVNGIPTIKSNYKEIIHNDGHKDIIINVPCMKLNSN